MDDKNLWGFGYCIGIFLGIVIVIVGGMIEGFEKKDIPRLCEENNICLEDVNYLSKYTNNSRYTTYVVLKRGKESGSDIWTILEDLESNITPHDVEIIISNLKEEY